MPKRSNMIAGKSILRENKNGSDLVQSKIEEDLKDESMVQEESNLENEEQNNHGGSKGSTLLSSHLS